MRLRRFRRAHYKPYDDAENIISKCLNQILQTRFNRNPNDYLSLTSITFVILCFLAAIPMYSCQSSSFRTFCLKNQKGCDSR